MFMSSKTIQRYHLLFLCSSISSSLNSAAAIVYEDFLRPLPYFDRMADAGQVGKLCSVTLFQNRNERRRKATK